MDELSDGLTDITRTKCVELTVRQMSFATRDNLEVANKKGGGLAVVGLYKPASPVLKAALDEETLDAWIEARLENPNEASRGRGYALLGIEQCYRYGSNGLIAFDNRGEVIGAAGLYHAKEMLVGDELVMASCAVWVGAVNPGLGVGTALAACAARCALPKLEPMLVTYTPAARDFWVSGMGGKPVGPSSYLAVARWFSRDRNWPGLPPGVRFRFRGKCLSTASSWPQPLVPNRDLAGNSDKPGGKAARIDFLLFSQPFSAFLHRPDAVSPQERSNSWPLANTS